MDREKLIQRLRDIEITMRMGEFYAAKCELNVVIKVLEREKEDDKHGR